MKYLKLTSLLFIATLFFASCDKDKTEVFGVKDFTHSDCKNNSKKNFLNEPETITLKTIGENELKITRKNVTFNCCPGELKVETSLIGDTLTLKEYSTENSCNCICPYDLEYTIEELEYGNVVFLITTKDYYESYRFKFNLNSNTDTTITIN